MRRFSWEYDKRTKNWHLKDSEGKITNNYSIGWGRSDDYVLKINRKVVDRDGSLGVLKSVGEAKALREQG